MTEVGKALDDDPLVVALGPVEDCLLEITGILEELA